MVLASATLAGVTESSKLKQSSMAAPTELRLVNIEQTASHLLSLGSYLFKLIHNILYLINYLNLFILINK